MSETLRTLIINALVLFLLVAIFDVVMFFSLPGGHLSRFPEYRMDSRPNLHGNGTFENDYFATHRERGFDIAADRQGSHWVDGVTYPIWSNSFGCFDNDYPDNFDSDYIYFAGDSFTWGFTPFDQKFGSILERATGWPIFTCGVIHTGQRHQFGKLVDVASRVGRSPRSIFVFFYSNDIANDYAHPHTTVIDGWRVDSVSIGTSNELIHHSFEELESHIENAVERLELRLRTEELASWSAKAKRALKFYSLSTNILDFLKDSLLIQIADSNDSQGPVPERRHIYDLSVERDGKYWYLDNPVSTANQSALLDFKSFSAERGSELVVVLIPPKEKALDTEWYAEIRDFLSEMEFRFLDLTVEFSERKLVPRDLYWVHDPHLSPVGNAAIAEILLDEFPVTFGSRHLVK